MYRFGSLRKNINLVVACQARDWGIAYKGKIPWHTPTDLQHFKKVTTERRNQNLRNAVIMGRKTYDSIGKPLPNRLNYVITRNRELDVHNNSELIYIRDLKDAIMRSTNDPTVESVYIVGGAEIYDQTLSDWSEYLDTAYVTFVGTDHQCDRFLTRKLYDLNNATSTQGEEQDGTKLSFTEWRPYNAGEQEYLNLIRRILADGELRKNRTGIDTISLFGERMVFDISERIPFITTKRLAWKTMLRELLWFISGDTNNATLQARGVHIWDGNSTREYLDSRGLYDRDVGDLGPVYGFQWRHFGAEYTNCHADYTGKGVDQLARVVHLIRTDPTSRRIILSAWNPAAEHLMALPPCHIISQWYVRDGKYLDCMLYQRSADVALGVPFNIASYSVLTYMLANITGYKPGRFIHNLGDAHLYDNHIDPVKKQLERVPYVFPRLQLNAVKEIDDFTEQDFELVEYRCHPGIKMEMAV